MVDRVVKRVRVVTKIPSPPKPVTLKRVAAYARVSTDSDEQMDSLTTVRKLNNKCVEVYFKKDYITNSIFA